MRRLAPLAALLCVAPCWADGLAPCVQKSASGVIEPATLAALRDCQDTNLAAYEKAHPNLSDDEADRLDDIQRAEVREYLSRHPSRAALSEPPAAGNDLKLPAPSGRSTPPAAPGTQIDGLDALTATLAQEGGNGSQGITPQMAQQIADYLNKQQGGMSADMSALLSSLQKDGPNLSDESALRLKQAARAAKAQGINLNLPDPKVEQWLLDPSTDPKIELQGPPSN
jgi:hypothetical protein